MDTKVSKCGDNLYIAIPADAAAQLKWTPGDILSVDYVDDGMKFVRTTTAHDHAMAIARQAMNDYQETFAALAKS